LRGERLPLSRGRWSAGEAVQKGEVELNPERPPIDEGDLGRFYCFSRGDEVSATHEAVLDAPGCVEPVD
jgi:hypothetical protein